MQTAASWAQLELCCQQLKGDDLFPLLSSSKATLLSAVGSARFWQRVTRKIKGLQHNREAQRAGTLQPREGKVQVESQHAEIPEEIGGQRQALFSGAHWHRTFSS